MEPVSLIVAALTAGALAGAKDATAQMVNDAYTHLKALAARRLHGQSTGERALEQLSDNPDTWNRMLVAELEQVQAGEDDELVAAAQRLMTVMDPEGAKAGRYHVDARGAQGVQVGDQGVQSNVFHAPPSA